MAHHVIPDVKKQQVECGTGSKPQGLYPPLGDPLFSAAEPPKGSATFLPAGNQMLKHMVGGGVAISHSNHKKDEEKMGADSYKGYREL